MEACVLGRCMSEVSLGSDVIRGECRGVAISSLSLFESVCAVGGRDGQAGSRTDSNEERQTKVKTRTQQIVPYRTHTHIWRFPKNGVPFLGVPFKGFHSIWGIKGVPLFWE